MMNRNIYALGLATLLFASGSWFWLQAAERKKPQATLPEAVSRTVQRVAPEADIVRVEDDEDDGERTYEVRLKRRTDGREINVEVFANGQLQDIAEDIVRDELPERVWRAAQRAFPKGAFKEARKVSEIRVTYRIELAVEGKRRELTISPRGKILEIEND